MKRKGRIYRYVESGRRLKRFKKSWNKWLLSDLIRFQLYPPDPRKHYGPIHSLDPSPFRGAAKDRMWQITKSKRGIKKFREKLKRAEK